MTQGNATHYDLIVIGSGPGGYVAAIRAAQLGMRSAVVEADALGGVCLNRGCIPTKALLHCANVGRMVSQAGKFGWDTEQPQLNLAGVVRHADTTAQRLASGVEYLLRKHEVDVLKGWGKLHEPGVVEVSTDSSSMLVSSGHIVIATGASARSLNDLPFDGALVWTSTDALFPTEIPERLLVIGSGAIGIEFASIYNTLGSSVTVAEIQPRILPAEDEDIAIFVRESMERQGIEILTDCTYSNPDIGKECVTVTLTGANPVTESGQTQTSELTRSAMPELSQNNVGDSTQVSRQNSTQNSTSQMREFDKVLVAIGVNGNIKNIGLEALGVTTHENHIVTDQWKATNVDGIYAIGDVSGAPWLAHKASHEATLCVERIAGLATAHPLDRMKVPGCTYSHPQVASIGLTEKQARSNGRSVSVGRFRFGANGKALAVGESEGLVKSVFDSSTGEILGVHMVGEGVTELINSVSIAMTLECTEEFLMRTVFAHPTLSEMLHESTLDAFDRAIHQ